MGHRKEIRGYIQFDDWRFDNMDDKIKIWKKNYGELVDALKKWITVSESKYQESIKDSFFLHLGYDGVIFLFIGTRVKDYFGDIEKFIQNIIEKFPFCNGIIFFNEKEHEQSPHEKVWFIKEGKISETRIDSVSDLVDNRNKI